MMGFASFLRQAMGKDQAVAPYPYQESFATAATFPQLVRVPTSAGKTAAAILGWLYRWQARPEKTPRRLAYCLPMRVLVEQSEREARRWIANLGLDVPVHVIMGGVEASEWYLRPEVPALLIGTQDMLLSRALNRGYAASRFHWPIDFGLLNNDCLWVFDEPQLMGAGVSTSAQLAGLRRSYDSFGACPSVWMSATLEPGWLATVDFRDALKAHDNLLELSDADYDPNRPLFQRLTASKTLAPLNVASSKDMKDAARAIWGVHRPDSQTLVIANTVERAKAVFDELSKLRKKSSTPDLLLVHSRYRPAERRILVDQLRQSAGDRILIATQVVEAGVDISARTLVTEVAPWPSLVQRMGRCNRTGLDGPGEVYWVDIDDEKLSPPYAGDDLRKARGYLEKLAGQSVAPRDLDRFKTQENIVLPFEHKHVLRRRDLLDLFDTTPDLSGNDVDIQRFVRGDDLETDVQVFWRDLGGNSPSAELVAPQRDELCNVPIGQARSFLESRAEKKRVVGFVWDHLDELWNKVDPKSLRPGMTVLLPATIGGYDWNDATSSGKGWDAAAEQAVGERTDDGTPEESAGSDPHSALAGPALTIAQHTDHVCQELASLLAAIKLDAPWGQHLLQAARWHDLGKAHWSFQRGMRAANPALDEHQLWAKSGKQTRLKHGRKFFRHELASALAAFQHGLPFVVAYLVASHHGRARVAIRALPGEDEPVASDTLFALGNHHGDVLPNVDLGDEIVTTFELDLTPMRIGGERSWTANALALLDALGPFRLAYLESLLRIADARASRKEVSDA